MIGARTFLAAMIAFGAFPVFGQSQDGTAAVDVPKILTEHAAQARDPEVRCYAFFQAVNVLWAVAAPYGNDARSVFDWSFAEDIFLGYDDVMRGQVTSSDYIQHYLDTFGPVDPSVNVLHPLYIADKAFCLKYGEVTS